MTPMDPYRISQVNERASADRVLEESVGNSDVAVPLFIVGALGVLLGALSPRCTVEGALGALCLVGALKTLTDDALWRRARSPMPPERPGAVNDESARTALAIRRTLRELKLRG